MKTIRKRVLSLFTAMVMVCSLVVWLPSTDIHVRAANTADSLVAIAEGALGKTDGTKYAKACWAIGGSYNYAWCAAFVSWCARQAGVDSIPTQTSCYNMYKGTPVNIGDDIYANLLVNKNWLSVSNKNDKIVLSNDSDASVYWHFRRQSDGSYTIQSCSDGSYLDVYNADNENGTIVEPFVYNGNDNQRWYIYGRWSGEYYLRPKSSNDKVLDVNGGKNQVGDKLNIWQLNYSDAQKFAIYTYPKVGTANISVTAGTSKSDTKFTWTKATDAKDYVIKIWKNKLFEGDSYKEFRTMDTNYSITLPEGTYQAYVDSCNTYFYNMSNTVTFTVEKYICKHKYTSKITIEPTCIKNGMRTYTCSECGDTYTESIPATGHKWNAVTYTWSADNKTCIG